MRLADFGQTMKKYRKKHHMTQEVLAEVLGVQTKHISLLENGHRNPSPELQKKMEDLLLKDEIEQAFQAESVKLSEKEMEVQLTLFHKLCRIHPLQKDKAVELICQILDTMAGKESGR